MSILKASCQILSHLMCDGYFNSGTKCIRLATPQSKTPALCSQVCGLLRATKGRSDCWRWTAKKLRVELLLLQKAACQASKVRRSSSLVSHWTVTRIKCCPFNNNKKKRKPPADPNLTRTCNRKSDWFALNVKDVWFAHAATFPGCQFASHA